MFQLLLDYPNRSSVKKFSEKINLPIWEDKGYQLLLEIGCITPQACSHACIFAFPHKQPSNALFDFDLENVDYNPSNYCCLAVQSATKPSQLPIEKELIFKKAQEQAKCYIISKR